MDLTCVDLTSNAGVVLGAAVVVGRGALWALDKFAHDKPWAQQIANPLGAALGGKKQRYAPAAQKDGAP